MNRRLLFTLATLTVGFHNASACAAVVINLQNAGTTTVTQGLTGAITIAAANTGDAFALVGLEWGIQLIPQGSVSGDLTVTGIAAPASGSPWVDPSVFGPDAVSLTQGPINGSGGYAGMTIGENDLSSPGTIASGQTPNLGTVTVTATSDALGTWLLYVINETDSDSGFPVSFLTDDTFTDIEFANLVAPASGTPGVSFLAGTVQVVPEPRGFGVTAVVAAATFAIALSWFRRFRRSPTALSVAGVGSVARALP